MTDASGSWSTLYAYFREARGIPRQEPVNRAAFIALNKLNKLRCGTVASAPRCCLTGYDDIYQRDDPFTLIPWDDAESAPLIAYLIAIGYLPGDEQRRKEAKLDISNCWPLESEIRGFLKANPTSPVLWVPTDIDALVKGCLQYLQRAAEEHQRMDQPWTFDWDKLREECATVHVMGNAVHNYTKWFLPAPEAWQKSSFPWRHLVHRDDGSVRMFDTEHSRELPLKYNVTDKPWTLYHVPEPSAPPSCWLFMDPFLATILAVQSIHLRGCKAALKPDALREVQKMEVLLRLLESPYPSAYRVIRMQEALSRLGLAPEQSTSETNTAPRAFHRPQYEVEVPLPFAIPPLSQAPYSMVSDGTNGKDFWANVNGIAWMIPDDVQLPFVIEDDDKGKINITQEKGDILKYVPSETAVESIMNRRAVVHAHTHSMWDLIWDKLTSGGDNSKAISRQLSRFLREGTGYVDDGHRLAAQVREESHCYRWCLEDTIKDITSDDERKAVVEAVQPR